MFGMIAGQLLKKAVEHVQNKNRSNPDVNTADNSVFENILDKFKNKQQQADDPATSYTPSAEEFCDDLCNDVQEVQVANEANPNVETADASVFNDMKAQLEALKAQIAQQEIAPTINTMPRPNLSSVSGASAITSSNNGSLGFRLEPNMESAMRDVRIPDKSRLTVLEYSENSIMLDGNKSRFAKVEYNGQLGWVLESYLNIQ